MHIYTALIGLHVLLVNEINWSVRPFSLWQLSRQVQSGVQGIQEWQSIWDRICLGSSCTQELGSATPVCAMILPGRTSLQGVT